MENSKQNDALKIESEEDKLIAKKKQILKTFKNMSVAFVEFASGKEIKYYYIFKYFLELYKRIASFIYFSLYNH